MKGSYVLLIRLDRDRNIEIGALHFRYFPEGYYCYVGSAMGPGGIEARIERHMREKKKIRWHIDYFLKYAKIEKAYFSEEAGEIEIARIFSRHFEGISGFGASDSPLDSHLFFGEKGEFEAIIAHLGLHPFL